MDPRTDRVELDPQDQAHVVAVVDLLRSAKAVSVLVLLRRLLPREEVEAIAQVLAEPRGQSGRW